MDTPVNPQGLRLSLWRVVFASLALALAGVSLAGYFSWRSEQRAVIGLMEGSGLAASLPDVAETIRREPDPLRAKLALARALLVLAVDFEGISKLPMAQAAIEITRTSERLDLAEKLATEVIALRPAAWEAPMVLGAARYLKLLRSGDARLFTEPEYWEKPLLHAMTLSPAEDEPVRFLARAKLETWPALLPEEQGQARVLLQRAFRDPVTFSRLAPLWLATASAPEDAFTLVPGTSDAWFVVRDVYKRKGRWMLFCAAHKKYLAALGNEINTDLESIVKHLSGGDTVGATRLIYTGVAKAPVSGALCQPVERMLMLAPPGLPPRQVESALRAWLLWCEERFILGQKGMETATVRRIDGALAGLEPPEAALAAAVAGDLDVAEVFERREGALNTERWAPYCLAKARLLFTRKEYAEALRILSGTHRETRDGALAALLRLQLAEEVRDPVILSAAREDLGKHVVTNWPATGWRWRGRLPWREIYLEKEVSGFELILDVVPPAGAVVSVVLDGDEIQVSVAEKGLPIKLPVAVGAGVHRLALVTLAGGRAVVPGELLLVR